MTTKSKLDDTSVLIAAILIQEIVIGLLTVYIIIKLL